ADGDQPCRDVRSFPAKGRHRGRKRCGSRPLGPGKTRDPHRGDDERQRRLYALRGDDGHRLADHGAFPGTRGRRERPIEIRARNRQIRRARRTDAGRDRDAARRPGGRPEKADRMRKLKIAAAQLGPLHRADSRALAARRMVELLRQAHGMGAKFVVFPELAFTTFFPRWWVEDQEEVDRRYFESTVPSKETAALFEEAKKLGIGFYVGYAELTPQKQRFNTAILVS